MRDVKAVGNKFVHVLIPRDDSELLKDWDLWGPLLLCTLLAILLQGHSGGKLCFHFIKARINPKLPSFSHCSTIYWNFENIIFMILKCQFLRSKNNPHLVQVPMMEGHSLRRCLLLSGQELQWSQWTLNYWTANCKLVCPFIYQIYEMMYRTLV